MDTGWPRSSIRSPAPPKLENQHRNGVGNPALLFFGIEFEPWSHLAEKALTDAIQGWRLKDSLFTLKFRLDEAEKAYETALHYINRETNPQLWAKTEVDVGIAHRELGIRVEAKAGNEHLAASITAYRSALEVYTREQLPQDWARPRLTWVTRSMIRRLGPRGEMAPSFWPGR
jgi:hypothetical protein